MASNDLSCKFCGKPYEKPSMVRSHEKTCKFSPDYKDIDLRKRNVPIIGDKRTSREKRTYTDKKRRAIDKYNKNILTVSISASARDRIDAMVDPRQQISRSSIIRDAITALINANVLWDEIEKWDEETPKHELIGVAINLKKNVKTTLGSVDNRSAFVRYAIWKYFDGRA